MLTGCSLYAKWHYKINPKKSPSSLSEYVLHTGAKDIVSDSIFFRPDPSLFTDFLLQRVFKDSQFVFMGTYLNDSCYLPSKAKEGNNACIGQIEKEIVELLKGSNIDPTKIKYGIPLTGYGLTRMLDAKPLTNSYFDKPVLVFLYSYRYGRYYKSLWMNIYNKTIEKETGLKMMFISIDNSLSF